MPITTTLLLHMVSLLDPSNPLLAAMWALFLVAFFSFLRKSNLVVQSASVISPKVHGAFLNMRVTKTIQFFQWALCIPLHSILGSPLCPVAALAHHLRFNVVGPSDPLFSVRSGSPPSSCPLTFRHFSSF